MEHWLACFRCLPPVSSRVVDTLGHTSTPIFSVDRRLFIIFPGHAYALQVLAYIVSIQFFLGLPGFRLALWSACQYIACFGILLSSMRSSHLSLLSLMMRFNNSSNFVCCLTASFRAETCDGLLPFFFFCVTERGHSSALYNSVDMTKVSYGLTLTFKLICLLFHISFSLPNITYPT